MHSKKDNLEIMINDKEDEAINKRFDFLLYRYQIELETSTKGRTLFLIVLTFCITNVVIK